MVGAGMVAVSPAFTYFLLMKVGILTAWKCGTDWDRSRVLHWRRGGMGRSMLATRVMKNGRKIPRFSRRSCSRGSAVARIKEKGREIHRSPMFFYKTKLYLATATVSLPY